MIVLYGDHEVHQVLSPKAYKFWLHLGEAAQDWLPNIILIANKNVKILISIDFHDLNEAFFKDKFTLPISDVMINKH